jgi:hypothetical protein
MCETEGPGTSMRGRGIPGYRSVCVEREREKERSGISIRGRGIPGYQDIHIYICIEREREREREIGREGGREGGRQRNPALR